MMRSMLEGGIMTVKRKLLLAGLLVCFAEFTVWAYIHYLPKKIAATVPAAVPDPAPHCTTIHKPASGCPPGWTEAANFFKEPDGSTQTACLAPPGIDAEPCIDIIYPGESFELHFTIRTKPDPRT